MGTLLVCIRKTFYLMFHFRLGLADYGAEKVWYRYADSLEMTDDADGFGQGQVGNEKVEQWDVEMERAGNGYVHKPDHSDIHGVPDVFESPVLHGPATEMVALEGGVDAKDEIYGHGNGEYRDQIGICPDKGADRGNTDTQDGLYLPQIDKGNQGGKKRVTCRGYGWHHGRFVLRVVYHRPLQ